MEEENKDGNITLTSFRSSEPARPTQSAEGGKDKSPEAREGRRKMAIRAAYGEFICSLIFYTTIFASISNGTQAGWSPEGTGLITSLVAGLEAVAVSFAFSSISGAHFNSAISFALWLTGKLSNRKALMYIGVQFLASVVGMGIVTACFSGGLQDAYEACAVVPPEGASEGKTFATEFFTTFILTYIAFTVAFEDAERGKKETMSFKAVEYSEGLSLYASTPQSKSGFAPFAIGFTIFSLGLFGGSSGAAFNPGRVFGPAIFSGKWKHIWLYWLAGLCLYTLSHCCLILTMNERFV